MVGECKPESDGIGDFWSNLGALEESEPNSPFIALTPLTTYTCLNIALLLFYSHYICCQDLFVNIA